MILGEASLSNLATALASWSVFSTFSVKRIFLRGTPYFIATSLRYSPSGLPTYQGSLPPVSIIIGALFFLINSMPAKIRSDASPHS